MSSDASRLDHLDSHDFKSVFVPLPSSPNSESPPKPGSGPARTLPRHISCAGHETRCAHPADGISPPAPCPNVTWLAWTVVTGESMTE
jgi:hypothetical protein